MSAAVPVLVLTRREDNAEAINSILRNAGHAVRCTRRDDASDMAELLSRAQVELVVLFADEADALLAQATRIRDGSNPDIPLVTCREQLTEDLLGADMQAGAADLVTLGNRERLAMVLLREIRSGRLARALSEAMSSASEYKKQLHTLVSDSASAIAIVSEGIVVDANPAWCRLFGYEGEDALVGFPIMDLVAQESQATLKGALVACMKDKWPGEALRVTGSSRGGDALPMELALETADFEGERCVRVSIAGKETEAPRKEEKPDKVSKKAMEELREMVNRDALTGAWSRQYFLDALHAELEANPKGGVRAFAVLRPDGFGEVVRELGVMASEEIIGGLAEVVRRQLLPEDLFGRLGGNVFGVFVGRGNTRDVSAWGDNVCSKISAAVFESGDKSVSVTASLGIAVVDAQNRDAETLLGEAFAGCYKAREDGGNQVKLREQDATTTRIEQADKMWVLRIKRALMENRFRLAHQPIAKLTGEQSGLYDVLVRMLDEQGHEILPSEFMPSASRNKVVKNIDRWVIGAAFSFVMARKPRQIFVRLSRDSMMDKTLLKWLEARIQSTRVKPGQIVFQVSVQEVEQHLNAAKALAENLRKIGYGFCIENFGLGSRAAQVIEHVPMDYLKIDGSLMQGLASNSATQGQVKEIITAANERKIPSIAERVEDANTMAALWQLGVHFIQGYQIREPEVVLAEGDS